MCNVTRLKIDILDEENVEIKEKVGLQDDY